MKLSSRHEVCTQRHTTLPRRRSQAAVPDTDQMTYYLTNSYLEILSRVRSYYQVEAAHEHVVVVVFVVVVLVVVVVVVVVVVGWWLLVVGCWLVVVEIQKF